MYYVSAQCGARGDITDVGESDITSCICKLLVVQVGRLSGLDGRHR